MASQPFALSTLFIDKGSVMHSSVSWAVFAAFKKGSSKGFVL
jgi:hypothetical protein